MLRQQIALVVGVAISLGAVWAVVPRVRPFMLDFRSARTLQMSIQVDERSRPTTAFSYYIDRAGNQVKHGEQLVYDWEGHRLQIDYYQFGQFQNLTSVPLGEHGERLYQSP